MFHNYSASNLKPELVQLFWLLLSDNYYNSLKSGKWSCTTCQANLIFCLIMVFKKNHKSFIRAFFFFFKERNPSIDDLNLQSALGIQASISFWVFVPSLGQQLLLALSPTFVICHHLCETPDLLEISVVSLHDVVFLLSRVTSACSLSVRSVLRSRNISLARVQLPFEDQGRVGFLSVPRL